MSKPGQQWQGISPWDDMGKNPRDEPDTKGNTSSSMWHLIVGVLFAGFTKHVPNK